MENQTDYESLIAQYGSPLHVAYALGFAKPTSSRVKKDRAGARVGMWKYNGIPKKVAAKLEKIVNAGA